MKKEKNPLVFVTILCVIVLILCAYVVCTKLLTNNKGNNENREISLKIDDTKEWVYDADYNLPTDKESYYGYSDHSKLISAKDLKVPYINISSMDATNANKEIYALYEQLIETFNTNAEDEIWFTTVKYEVFENNNIISVIITTEAAGTDTPLYTYYTYNFSLDDGKLLSYSDVYEKLGYDETSIKEKVTNAVTNATKEKYDQSDFDTYTNQSITNYTASVNDGNIKYYVDGNNKLNIVVTLVIPAGRGYFDTILTLD